MLRISLKAEKITTLFGLPVTNTLLTSVIVLILVFIIGIFYKRSCEKEKRNTFFYLITISLKLVYNLFESILGERIDFFFPLLGAFFFFIIIHNELGLLPGFGSILIKVKESIQLVQVPLLRGATTDLNTTLALGLISVIFAQYAGIKFLGTGGFYKKFFNFSNATAFFAGIMETIQEFSKVIAFTFRLFGNIFAGEVVILIMAFLMPVLLSFPFLLFEIFIGFIQAVVFAMLSAVFFSLAIEKAHY